MAPIGFWLKKQPKNIDPTFRPKNGPNRPKWPPKEVNEIKNFCFFHHTSPKFYLEHGPNHFFARKSDQKKLTPLLSPKMAKIG
jgi:hypothetical protein